MAVSNTNQVDVDLPILSGRQQGSDVTDLTDPRVNNNEFLRAIFGDLEGSQRPIYCSFVGHPGKTSPTNWFGKPWVPETYTAPGNCYFTLATYNPDSDGQYRRKKINFVAQYAIMLDDIGTKAGEVELLTLPPSWRLETSPGNFQVGYILIEPIEDGATIECLMGLIVDAGLCDPGASGPMTRYARLPVGINGKYDPPFECRLLEWHPERRYCIKDLEDGLRLSCPRKDKEQNLVQTDGLDTKSLHSELYIPRPQVKTILTRLKEAGLYLKSTKNGTHEIRCPWQSEHTDTLSGGTYYYEPSKPYKTGGFKCFHGHCKDRNLWNLCEKLGVTKNEQGSRPTIRLKPGYLDKIIDLCEQESANVGKFYQRGGLIVNIIRDPGTKEISISAVAKLSILRALSFFVHFEKFDKRSNRWTHCDPPERYCRMLYESDHYSHLPVLQGLAKQPYLRPDGSLMCKPGYDPDTGMFGLFNPFKFRVSNAPYKRSAEHALAKINDLLSEFKFKTDHDRSAALAAILTATIRSSLSLAPMFHCRAPQISSGKSYLTSLISAFATASPSSGAPFPATDEECRKLLLATLLTSPSVICFDNLTTDIYPHKTLCSALTEEYITGRILGVSKIATVSTKTLILSSGNNVGPIRDMSRRAVTINLDTACEVPATRVFSMDPLPMVRKHREAYVSLALKIIRAWIVAGKPRAKVDQLATYGDWSDLCRQPLLWLGCPDPAKSVFLSMKQDPDREILGRLLHAWHDCFNNQSIMIREAINKAEHQLAEVFMDIAGERGHLNNKRLGRWISRHADRIVDGLKFVKDSGTRSAVAWRVESVTSVS